MPTSGVRFESLRPYTHWFTGMDAKWGCGRGSSRNLSALLSLTSTQLLCPGTITCPWCPHLSNYSILEMWPQLLDPIRSHIGKNDAVCTEHASLESLGLRKH
jgi:hypothetical protein